MPAEQHELKNNVTLITEPAADVKTAAVGFWFSAGSRYEPENARGISHFTEHLLFKRTKSRSAFEIARSFDRIGGYVNAFTDKEHICVYCVIPANCIGVALEILCDMIQNSLIHDDDILRERSVIESEIITSLDDPEEAALDAVAETVWKHQSAGRNIAGSLADVRGISSEQLRDWYRRHIAGGKLIVCAAGNFNSIYIKNCLEQLLAKRSCGERIPDAAYTAWNSGISFVKAPFQQEQFFLLYPVMPPATFRQSAVRDIFNALAGDTMSSRLFQRLREQKGYCYSVYSFFSLLSDCGFWCAYASASSEQAEEIVDDLCSEMERLFSDEIGDDEIESAKQHICGEMLISSEDAEYRIKRLAHNYFCGFPQNNADDAIQTVQDIGKNELTEEIRCILGQHNRALVVYGPRIKSLTMKKITGRFRANGQH